MTEENNTEELEEENKSASLSQLLGMKFEKDGKWSASDTGNSPIMRRLNRQERRRQAKMDRRKGK